jgi:KDO2-lipid IV(A) lauroyltransferase
MIAAFAERLAAGAGFRFHFQRVSTEQFDETALNRLVEELVRRCPSQFLWSYNRYRMPSKARAQGATLPEG